MKYIAGLSRIIVGALFIFSGFIKANDPLGFSYKLNEYFELFGMAFLNPVSVYLAMLICAAEIVLGLATLLGSSMKITTTLLLLMIIFFTWLTGYSAVTGKVTDCGCFGDAIKLTPWQSFYKDVILLILIGILWARRNQIRSIFSVHRQSFLITASAVISLVFTFYCFTFQPVKNFLKFKIGSDVRALTVLPPDAPKDSFEINFIYKVNGEMKTYTMEQLGELPEGAEYVDRKDRLVRAGAGPAVKDFVIARNGNSDVTEEVRDSPGYKLIIVAYTLDKSSKRAFKKLRELALDLQKDNPDIKIYCLTATDAEKAEAFRHEHQLPFEFLRADGTLLKGMIRSNPGLMLWNGSVIVDTWSAPSIPNAARVKAKMK